MKPLRSIVICCVLLCVAATVQGGTPGKTVATAISWSATVEMTADGWIAGVVPEKFALRTCEEARKEFEKLRSKLDGLPESGTAAKAIDEVERSIEKFQLALKRNDPRSAHAAAMEISRVCAGLRRIGGNAGSS